MTDQLTNNGTALPTPEAMLALYLTGVRVNDAVRDVAGADRPEIRWEIVEQWENANEPIQDDDHDIWMAVADVAAAAAILICQIEIRTGVHDE